MEVAKRLGDQLAGLDPGGDPQLRVVKYVQHLGFGAVFQGDDWLAIEQVAVALLGNVWGHVSQSAFKSLEGKMLTFARCSKEVGLVGSVSA
jgi:hypothetical protein